MADQPARKFNPDIEPDIKPHFGVVQGGGQSTPDRGNLSAVPATGDTEQEVGEQSKPRHLSVVGGTNDNIDDVSSREQSGQWATQVGTKQNANKDLKVSFVKRKGPLGVIIGLLVGGGGLAGFLLAPSSLPITMMETLTNDTDDASSWNSRKVHKLFGKKLGDMQKKVGYCGRAITIRCKFSTMSKWQADRFRNVPGISFEGETKRGITGGRVAFNALVFEDPISGERVRASNPSELNKVLREKPFARSMMYRGFNPMTSKFLGNRFGSFLLDRGLSKQKKIKGDNKEQVDQSYDESNTDEDTEDGDKRATPDNDEAPDDETPEEREQRLQNNASNNAYVDELNKSLAEGKNNINTGKASGALGILRGACAAHTVGTIISAASKTLKALRLAKFAMIFLTGAAAMKAGEATAAEVQKMTDILVPSTYPEKVENNDGEMIDNPNIGKNALDSEAFRIIAYGDSGDLSTIASRFFIAGGVGGTLGKILSVINKNRTIKNSIRTSCNLANSKFATVADLALSVSGIGGVIKTALGFAAGAALGPLMGKLLGNALKKAIDWASGKDLTTDIIGVDAGNAIFAGMAYIMSGASATVGMKPGKAAEIVKNMIANAGTQQTYIANERYNARSTPFDANNPHSFLGTVLTNIRGTATVRPVSQVQSILANGLNPLKFITKDANAAYSMPITTVTEDRFKQCEDPGYDNLGIDADRFCNVRMVPFEDREIEDVIDYMLEHEHITEEGEPSSEEFETWIENCTQRQAGWGEDNNGSDGRECMEDSEQNINFANYIAYYGADQDMDEEPTLQGTSDSALGAKFRVATLNILHGDTSNWPGRLQTSLGLLNEKGIGVAGLQEARPHQQKAIKDEYGDRYGIFPENHNQNPDSAVIWDNQKFELVREGSRQEPIQYDGGRKVNIAKLRYIEGGATGPEFYVMNTHDPINKRATSTCKNDRGEVVHGKSRCGPINRTQNARLYQQIAKEELTDAPVIMTGDFNMKLDLSGKNKPIGNVRENLTYCIMTRDDVLWYVSDAQQNKTGECPSQKDVLGENHIDQIYISTTMKASGYGVVANGTGSDHPMVYSDVEIPGAESTGAGTTFVIGTYNQKASWTHKHEDATRVIAEKGMEVVGTQETINPKYGNYKRALGQRNYGVFPDREPSGAANRTCASTQAIFYKKSKFKFIKGEWFDIPRYPDGAANCGGGEQTSHSRSRTVEGVPNLNWNHLPAVWTHIPVVWLQDATTGQTIIVINTHNVANVRGAAGTRPGYSRYVAANIYMNEIKRLKAENAGIPIFFTGDFNEGTGVRDSRNVTWKGNVNNLVFCMFAKNGLMFSTAGPPMKCGGYSIGGVDYIYATQGVKVDWARELSRGAAYSDHPAIYAKLTVPGSKDGNNKPDIVGDDYGRACASGNAPSGVDCNGECVDFVKYRLKKHVAKYGGESLGHGKSVAITLHNRYGYKLDNKPAVHAVFSTSHTSQPQFGHTGIVSKVNGDGSIVVEEYNFANGHAYGVRKISKAELQAKEYIFAHTEVDYK